MNEKIPVELASMVGDYETVNTVSKVTDTPEEEYHIFCKKLWLEGMEWLRNHGYEVTGVDIHTTESNLGKLRQVRIWIRKNQEPKVIERHSDFF